MKYKVGDPVYYKGWVKCPDIPDDEPPHFNVPTGIYKIAFVNTGKLPYCIFLNSGQEGEEDWNVWEGEIEPIKTDFKVEDFL